MHLIQGFGECECEWTTAEQNTPSTRYAIGINILCALYGLQSMANKTKTMIFLQSFIITFKLFDFVAPQCR